MRTIKNMLFALVASSLVFANVNAGEMTLNGSMEVALTKVDGETGNPIGLEYEMDIVGSTELDNGIGVSYKDDTGIWNKYFLFSEIKEAEKYFNKMKKQYGDAVSVHFNKVVY